ncbi:MAG: hypothetical protein U0527_06305 [Candidatus Eisenbacteria bacterium]
MKITVAVTLPWSDARSPLLMLSASLNSWPTWAGSRWKAPISPTWRDGCAMVVLNPPTSAPCGMPLMIGCPRSNRTRRGVAQPESKCELVGPATSFPCARMMTSPLEVEGMKPVPTGCTVEASIVTL